MDDSAVVIVILTLFTELLPADSLATACFDGVGEMGNMRIDIGDFSCGVDWSGSFDFCKKSEITR